MIISQKEIGTDSMTLYQALHKIANIQNRGKGVCAISATRGTHVIIVKTLKEHDRKNICLEG